MPPAASGARSAAARSAATEPSGAILGIETSCDETAAALVAPDGRVLSSIVASQAEVHRRYGGVVPELAARRHAEALGPVVAEALRQAGASWEDVGAIAATRGPGLVGALLVGLSAAKAIALARRLPIVGVNHLAGHVLAACLRDGDAASASPAPSWPAVALVVSGSHTDLLLIEADPTDPSRPGRLRRLGGTRDDAAGEAFDKVARLLGMGYPGGPAIERAAASAASAVDLPRPMLDDGFDFSFSGLKTAVAVLWEERAVGDAEADGPPAREAAAEVARGFQEAVVEVLVTKTVRAASACGVRQLVLCGGVAANGALRGALSEAAARRGWRLAVPPMRYCTDNAAMIAMAGAFALSAGRADDLSLDADPNLDFEEGPLPAWA